MEFYKPIYKCVTAISDIKAFLDNDKPVAFDFETAPDELYRREEKAALDAHKSHIVGISFSVSEGESIYVPLIHNSGDNADNQEELWSFLKATVFENKNRVKIAHNLAFEAMFLYAKGIIVQQPCHAMILSPLHSLRSKHLMSIEHCTTAD